MQRDSRHPNQDWQPYFSGDGNTAFLKGGGRIEVAQQMAGHESGRTTGLYDRRGDEVSIDEVEKIHI
jgi:integrase/recombinase XerD